MTVVSKFHNSTSIGADAMAIVAKAVRERVYRGRREPFDSLDELAAAAKQAWKEIPQDNVNKSIQRFLSRVELVTTNNGGPIQHLAR